MCKYEYEYACNKCVFVDAKAGSDTSGDGTEAKPYKTIAKGYANKAKYDGMVLIGEFDIGNNKVFVKDWSYTGHGVDTVLYISGGNRKVDGNKFYRMVFDFQHVAEGASFRGVGDVRFYNCVFRDQHTGDGGREFIYGDAASIQLTLENWCVEGEETVVLLVWGLCFFWGY